MTSQSQSNRTIATRLIAGLTEEDKGRSSQRGANKGIGSVEGSGVDGCCGDMIRQRGGNEVGVCNGETSQGGIGGREYGMVSLLECGEEGGRCSCECGRECSHTETVEGSGETSGVVGRLGLSGDQEGEGEHESSESHWKLDERRTRRSKLFLVQHPPPPVFFYILFTEDLSSTRL